MSDDAQEHRTSHPVLGHGWKGLAVPECPDCNDTADEWAFEPRISDQHADAIVADETDISELVRE